MLYFKACPKCRGDILLGKDIYSEYKQCIQCGYLEELEETTPIFEFLSAELWHTVKG